MAPVPRPSVEITGSIPSSGGDKVVTGSPPRDLKGSASIVELSASVELRVDISILISERTGTSWNE